MSKALLVAGGVLNTLFFLFHIMLGYQIFHLTQVAPPYRAFMEALNVAGVLFMFFFAYVSFFHGKDLLGTGLGRTVLVLVSALYLSRAAEEFFLFKFNFAIFGSCIVVGAIYAALLVIAIRQRPASPRASRAARPAAKASELRPAA